jgi:hypothetical protein
MAVNKVIIKKSAFKQQGIPLITRLINSFDNDSPGFSARKLSAFTGVVVAIIATFEFVDNTTITTVLGIWLIFSLMCLGIITADQLLRYLKGSKEEAFEELKDKPEEVKDKPEIEKDPVI